MSESVLGAEELAPSRGTSMVSSQPITDLDHDVKQKLELQRQFVTVVAAISSMSWGKGLTPGIQRSIATYCQEYDVDPLTELDVLGGNFYINSEWALRKLGELRRSGVIADFWLEHIQADPRLKAIIDDERQPEPVREEARRRWTDAMFKRVEHNAPEAAEAVCVCYIVLPGGGHPIKGCKWGGGGTSIKQPRGQGAAAQPNPIVESNAALSVESQSVRRAMRQVQSHVDRGRVPDIERMEEGLKSISARMTTVVDQQAAIDERAEREHHAALPVATSGSAGYVGELAPRQIAGEPAQVHTIDRAREIAHATLEHAARQPDPYTGEVPVPAPTTKLCRKCGRDLVGVTPEEWAAGEHRDDCTGTVQQSIEELFPAPPAGAVVGVDPGAAEGDRHVEASKCPECGNIIEAGHPEMHKGTCSKYAD